MDSLPVEIILIIARRLQPNDMMSLRSTSRWLATSLPIETFFDLSEKVISSTDEEFWMYVLSRDIDVPIKSTIRSSTENGHLMVFRHLTDTVPSVELTREVRETHIYTQYTCANRGHYQVLQMLRDHGLVLDELLYQCVINGDYSNLYLLTLNLGLTVADIRFQSNELLRKSAEMGNLKIVKFLCTKFPLSIDDARSVGNYALLLSAANGRTEMVKYLCARFLLAEDDARSVLCRLLTGKFYLSAPGLGCKWILCDERADRTEAVQFLRERFSIPLEDIHPSWL